MRPDWTSPDGTTANVYAVLDPNTRRVRYVGATKISIHKRLIQHRADAKHSGLRFHDWLVEIGVKPPVVTLQVVPLDKKHAAEKRWIRRLRARGCDLLNETDGGLGLCGHDFSLEHRERISAAKRKGRFFHCETCGNQFWREPHEIASGDCRFCSRDCYASWRRGRSMPVPASTTANGVKAAAAKRRAMTHCKRGHELTAGNVYVNKRGGRVCKECRKIHKKGIEVSHAG